MAKKKISNANGAIKDVDPVDIIEIVKKVIKVIGDLKK